MKSTIKHQKSTILFCLLFAPAAWATVPSTADFVKYDCDGTDTTFPFSFGVWNSSEVEVVLVDSTGPTTLVENSTYTVTLPNNDGWLVPGGTVTTTTAYAATYDIWIMRKLPWTQDSLWDTQTEIDPVTLEDDLDKSAVRDMQLLRQVRRSLRGGDYETADMNLPVGWSAASGYTYWNATQQKWVLSDTLATDEVAIGAFWENVVDESSLAGSLTAMGVSTEMSALVRAADNVAGRAAMQVSTACAVNVLDYGAIAGDDVNDASAFEDARDAAGDGGTIIVPQGKWTFDRAIDPGDYRTWYGVGLASELNCSATNSTGIFAESTDGVGYTDFIGLKLTSDNASATAIDVLGTHYMNHCSFTRVFISAKFYRGIDGLLGGCLFIDCDFGTDGSPGAFWQPIRSFGSYQALKNTWINCLFYYAIGASGSVQLDYSHTQHFLSCMWEQNDCPSIDANGVSELVVENPSFEVEEPGGTANCLIKLGYITTKDGAAIGQGCNLRMYNCRATNGASGSTPWDALVYTGGSGCWFSISQLSGGLGSTWLCKDSAGAYDYNQVLTSRGLRHADNISCTGYSGIAVITSTTVYDRAVKTIQQGTDPARVFMPQTATDTRWWQGITEDADGVSDDFYDFGTGATPGSELKLRLSTNGPLEDVNNVTADITNFDTWGLHIVSSNAAEISGAVADGAYVGQRVKFVCKVAGNNIDISVAHHVTSDPEVIRLDTAKEWVELVWDGTDWVEVGGNGQTYP